MGLDFGRGHASSTQDEGTMYNTKKLPLSLAGAPRSIYSGTNLACQDAKA